MFLYKVHIVSSKDGSNCARFLIPIFFFIKFAEKMQRKDKIVRGNVNTLHVGLVGMSTTANTVASVDQMTSTVLRSLDSVWENKPVHGSDFLVKNPNW